MSVSQPTIKSDLLALYNYARNNKMTEEEFADEMATIIKNAIISAVATGTDSGGDSHSLTIS